MTAPATHVPVYLDQNILSHLREGKPAREELLNILSKLQEKAAVFVYSHTHVDECRGSTEPESFVRVLEELPAYLMESQDCSDQQPTLSLGPARELMLEPEDPGHSAKRMIERLLNVSHYASGWLGVKEVGELRVEMLEEVAGFWETLRAEVDFDIIGGEIGRQALLAMRTAQNEMTTLIEGLPFEQAKAEWETGMSRLRDRMPANFAQLDAIPDENAVSFVFSCLEEPDSAVVQKQFPKGFWSRIKTRETGQLTGLAFMLFMCGLVRDRRVKKGVATSRMQHFLGQFRDGAHIENASRCAVFMTCDKGAARLARSIYAYAGLATQVVQLEVRNAAA